MSKLFTLSKTERIKSQKDIEALFQHGKAFFIFPFKVFYLIKEKADGLEPLQFMATAPKKHFRKATARNRIRRQIKEAYRLQKVALQELIIAYGKSVQLIFIYQTPEALGYDKIYQSVGDCLKKISKQL
jgi:ribonuclease P protein component